MNGDALVRDFRQILIWPLQLKRLRRESQFASPVDALSANPGPWRKVMDNLLLEDASVESGYQEFVYFLPYVQRFLYGYGDAANKAHSSTTIFRRDDVSHVEVTVLADEPPMRLEVGDVRLYFFYDMDVAILTFEVFAKNISLQQTVEMLDRFGRPYPPSWDESSQGNHCTREVRFFDHGGDLIAASDYCDREKYLSLVREVKQTPLSLHWEFLLKPLVPAYLGGGMIEYYQIENKRIPVMTFVAMDDPKSLSLGDLARLGCAAKWGPSDTLPYSARFLESFERTHCYDRYWDHSNDAFNTRYIFYGVAFTMLTKAGDRPELATFFRHQFFQIALIANFHKAALLNLSNRFSVAVERLKVGDYESVRDFKSGVRQNLENFLRFNHRYWFREISNQVQATDFFERFSREMGTDRLFHEVREEAQDINQYLDAERTRKQADNAMRLTVVTACGMVGTIVTGFLGMNLFEHHNLPTAAKIAVFAVVFVPTVALSVATVIISKRLATFMEALSSERMSWSEKVLAVGQIFRTKPKRRSGEIEAKPMLSRN
jgi:hypothetical protein